MEDYGVFQRVIWTCQRDVRFLFVIGKVQMSLKEVVGAMTNSLVAPMPRLDDFRSEFYEWKRCLLHCNFEVFKHAFV